MPLTITDIRESYEKTNDGTVKIVIEADVVHNGQQALIIHEGVDAPNSQWSYENFVAKIVALVKGHEHSVE